MKHVSLASIEKAIQIVDNLNDDQLEEISEKYALAQPELCGYAMSAAMEYENEQLEGLIIYYFVLLNEAFNQEGLTVKQVDEELIDAFETNYNEILDAYFENDDEDLLEEFCDQPHLVQFMAMELSIEDEDGTTLDDETATQLFVVITAVITLLGRATA